MSPTGPRRLRRALWCAGLALALLACSDDAGDDSAPSTTAAAESDSAATTKGLTVATPVARGARFSAHLSPEVSTGSQLALREDCIDPPRRWILTAGLPTVPPEVLELDEGEPIHLNRDRITVDSEDGTTIDLQAPEDGTCEEAHLCIGGDEDCTTFRWSA